MRSGYSWECWVGVRREGELGQSVKASWRKGHPGMQPLGPCMSTHSWAVGLSFQPWHPNLREDSSSAKTQSPSADNHLQTTLIEEASESEMTGPKDQAEGQARPPCSLASWPGPGATLAGSGACLSRERGLGPLRSLQPLPAGSAPHLFPAPWPAHTVHKEALHGHSHG